MSKDNIILSSGRSMIEMLGVIALGGIMTVATMQLYNYATTKSRSVQAENIITSASDDISTLLLGRGKGSEPNKFGNEWAEEKGVKLKDPWGKQMKLKWTGKENDSGRFSITITAPTAADCIHLIKRVVALRTSIDISKCENNANIEFFFK